MARARAQKGFGTETRVPGGGGIWVLLDVHVFWMVGFADLHLGFEKKIMKSRMEPPHVRETGLTDSAGLSVAVFHHNLCNTSRKTPKK